MILDAVRQTVADVAGECAGRVRGLSFSTAMHSLIGLDEGGAPLTPSITWADSRASAQAERLRGRARRPAAAPAHGHAHPPDVAADQAHLVPRAGARAGAGRSTHWVGIKEYVLLQLVDGLLMDHSVASGTGLMNIHTLRWDDEALRLAGVVAEQLPELVPTTHVLPPLTDEAASALGLSVDTPVVIGAGDGPLANLGSGAVRPGVVSCTIGTSGAMRVMVEDARVDPLGGVFCYALTESRWAVGGAINNGGLVLNWAGDALAPDLAAESDRDPYEALLDLAAERAGRLRWADHAAVPAERARAALEFAAARGVRRADP